VIRIHVISKTNFTDRSIISVDRENNWDQLQPEHFLSPQVIVLDMSFQILKEDREWIKKHDMADLIQLHHTVGRWIRNTYGLWHPNNPYVVKDDLGEGHPDGISQKCIYLFHSLLNDRRTEAYVDAMSILTQEK